MLRTRLALTIGAVFLTAACATEVPSSGPATSVSVATSQSSLPPTSSSVVPETLRFTVSTVDGQSFDAASLAGKPVAFWFWAAWCPTCKGDAAKVRLLQQQLAGKVNVVGVAGLGSGADGMRKFVTDYQLSGFPQLADDTGTVWKKFEVPSQHYYVILDSAGAIVHRGRLSISELQQRLSGLA
ncbi:redoxin domain-containing protein [Rhizocola hellebori]|nr:redoxin domain-containing protein [Rhizocola hellebori]